MKLNDLTVLLAIIGALTILTNLITEVIKPIAQVKIPTEITASCIAELLTMLSYFGYADYKGLTITWYTVVGTFVCGLLVSYAAQFGFDKLKSALMSIKDCGVIK